MMRNQESAARTLVMPGEAGVRSDYLITPHVESYESTRTGELITSFMPLRDLLESHTRGMAESS